jgi:hypothetical protein
VQPTRRRRWSVHYKIDGKVGLVADLPLFCTLLSVFLRHWVQRILVGVTLSGFGSRDGAGAFCGHRRQDHWMINIAGILANSFDARCHLRRRFAGFPRSGYQSFDASWISAQPEWTLRGWRTRTVAEASHTQRGRHAGRSVHQDWMTTKTPRRWVFDLKVSFSAMILDKGFFLRQSKAR